MSAIYSTPSAPAPPPTVPISRAWSPEEWPQVCALRAQLDAVLQMVPAERLAADITDALLELGPQLPCFAINAGTYLFLDLPGGQRIEEVPSEPQRRVELYTWLDRFCSSTLPVLPDGDGLFEASISDWMRCWSFRNRDPTSLVMDCALLGQPARWMICEAHERAHELDMDEQGSIQVELVVAETIADLDRFSEAPELLAESRRRLSGLQK